MIFYVCYLNDVRRSSAKNMFKVSVPINILRCHETKQFIVQSPALDLSSYGNTESQAIQMFGDAVQLFLSELERMGTMDDVLRELGWTKVRAQPFPWIPPEILHQKKLPIKVPVAHA